MGLGIHSLPLTLQLKFNIPVSDNNKNYRMSRNKPKKSMQDLHLEKYKHLLQDIKEVG